MHDEKHTSEPRAEEERNEDFSSIDDDGNESESFRSATSQSGWEKVRHTADRFLHRTVEIAGDTATKGKIEIEIASLKFRLRNLYAKAGERLFHVAEAEDDPNPFEDPEVMDVFEQIRGTLSHLATEKKRLEKLREDFKGQDRFV
ncbi:hypothetical protein K8I28_03215 [bacterium]|nr:hypothetical protein [bacterium]